MTTDPHLEVDIAWLDSTRPLVKDAWAIERNARIDRLIARAGSGQTPIPMILHCPSCGLQHVDAPEASLGPRFLDPGASEWTNPPHRSHLCRGCGSIWRPADVATEGVAVIQTKGSADHIVAPASPVGATLEQQDEQSQKFAGIKSDCPHAAPFRYCQTCAVNPCPIGFGEPK